MPASNRHASHAALHYAGLQQMQELTNSRLCCAGQKSEQILADHNSQVCPAATQEPKHANLPLLPATL